MPAAPGMHHLPALLARAAAATAAATPTPSDEVNPRYDTTASPADPHAPTTLTVNLGFRVSLAILSSLACVVPLRLLYKNGEFPAVVLILTVIILNCLTVVDSLIWRDDDVASWWSGDVWCDIHNYVYSPLLLVYAGCVLAIMRNLARQLGGSMRATPLNPRERARRALRQALVIFPLPVLQLAWIYPLAVQRYGISPLVGCVWLSDTSWPYVVFFVIPPPLLAILTAYYAVVTYLRFRRVQKQTRTAFGSSTSANRLAVARAGRAERRLFYMALSILIPYLPLTVYFSVDNLLSALPLGAFDFAALHDPETWWIVPPFPTDTVGFAFQNVVYVPILTALPIFWFFGMTKDAVNTYRRAAVAVGLARLFPRLREEYDPDSSLYATGTGSKGSAQPGPQQQRTLSLSFPHTEHKDMTIDTYAERDVEVGASSFVAAGPTTVIADTTPAAAPAATTTTPPKQSLLSKLCWAVFGFGQRRSQLESLSSEDLSVAAGRRPGPFAPFGATTSHIGSVMMRPSLPAPAAAVGQSGVAKATTASSSSSPAAARKAGIATPPLWQAATPSPAASEVQTRVWGGGGGSALSVGAANAAGAAAVAAAEDSDASELSRGAVVVTKSVTSRSEEIRK